MNGENIFKQIFMNTTLSVEDRIKIARLIPEQGNMIEMQIATDIVAKTKLSQEEIQKAEVRIDGQGLMTWKQGVLKDLNIEFSKLELDLLKKKIKELDETNKISVDMFKLCKRINEIGGEGGGYKPKKKNG